MYQPEVIACIDVGYENESALAACVVISDWQAAESAAEYVERIDQIQDYEPGEFYRRELPCIQAVLNRLPQPPTCVVIDGYVWLDEHQRPGLGAYLHDLLHNEVPVIGVAKSAFRGSHHAATVRRGESERALFVTSMGISITDAVANIKSMHGPFRIPTILKRVDQLSRGAECKTTGSWPCALKLQHLYENLSG